jgi:hypothetical protein
MGFQEPFMTIQVRCPNSACGKILSVRDDFAGKTGKCPSCGTTMPIPYPGEGPGAGKRPSRVQPQREEEDDDDRIAPSRSRRRRDDDDDDVPVASSRSRRRREEEDDYDDADDYDDRRSRRRSRYDEPRRRPRAREPFVATVVLLGVGIGVLIFLSFIPLFGMYMVSAAKNMPGQVKPEIAGMIKLTEGKILLIVTIVVAVVCVAALVLYFVTPQHISDAFITVTGCIAGGWGITLLLWIVGFVWDILAVNSFMKEAAGGRDEGGISPGIGLWLGLFLALAVVVIFAILIGLRGRAVWLYLGEGVGLLAGIILLTLNVQPWNTGKKEQMQDSKFAKRYLPLVKGFEKFTPR